MDDGSFKAREEVLGNYRIAGPFVALCLAGAPCVVCAQSLDAPGHAPTQPNPNPGVDYGRSASGARLSGQDGITSVSAKDAQLYQLRRDLHEVKEALKAPSLTDDQKKALKSKKAGIEHDIITLQQQ